MMFLSIRNSKICVAYIASIIYKSLLSLACKVSTFLHVLVLLQPYRATEMQLSALPSPRTSSPCLETIALRTQHSDFPDLPSPKLTPPCGTDWVL